MKALEGYTVIEQTETRIVQEKHFGNGGKITIVGNPNPDPVEQEKAIEDLSKFLLACHQRIVAEKELAKNKKA